MADLTRKLPPELLTKIVDHASARDALRFKQVNRTFHDVVLASPLIQHKIDLFFTGLEYNAATEVSLADSKQALLEYRSNLDSVCPREEKIADTGIYRSPVRVSGGVYATVTFKDSVRLFTLGSASRGIPYKEWEIPLPDTDPGVFCFCPGADVIAFFGGRQVMSDFQLEIHLRTLSDGRHHPAAQRPVIYYRQKVERMGYVRNTSISSSRLAIIEGPAAKTCLTVLDWKSSQVLFELEGRYHGELEFIDDHRLITILNDHIHPPSLRLIDTAKDREGTPMQTVFHFPEPSHPEGPFLRLEEGAHTPSQEGPSVPFHQDPTQRIIVLLLERWPHPLVFQVGTLLKLAESCEGCEFRWDEWGGRGIMPLLGPECEGIWVSGCRLFSVYGNEDDSGTDMRVYDFSARGLAKYLRKQVDGTYDSAATSSEVGAAFQSGAMYLPPTEARARIPLNSAQYPNVWYDNLLITHCYGIPARCTIHIWGFS